jgi:hypothetical protein
LLEQKSQGSTVGSPDNTCRHPFISFLVCRAPFPSTASDYNEKLEDGHMDLLNERIQNKLSIEKYFFDTSTYLWVQVKVCPIGKSFFNGTEIINSFDLNSEENELPKLFGPFYSIASPYRSSGICIL